MFQIDLTGKTVLITGALSGVGLGVAGMFAKAGANVSGCDLSQEGSKFVYELKQMGAQALYSSCDVTKAEELKIFISNTITVFGGIDILVSSAGKNFFSGAEKCDEENWAKNTDLNLGSHWRIAQLCKPHLEKSNGVIIIMTSNHAYQTIPGCFPYNVTKTALTGLVRSLAIEWGPAIRTIGLAPGFIDTPGNQQWFNSFPDPEAERERTVNLHPVKRIGTTEEIGAWCVFMASDYAAFASGTTYVIDGGRSALMQDS
jgi:NAD(P)-dependent dehydrogenase (short-subunit alcohol dehydrogenase family)